MSIDQMKSLLVYCSSHFHFNLVLRFRPGLLRARVPLWTASRLHTGGAILGFSIRRVEVKRFRAFLLDLLRK